MTPEVRDRIEQIRHGNMPEGYKKTSAGIIPLDWQCYAICECVQIKNNDRRPISEEVRKTMPGPYPYYGPTQAQGYIDSYMSEGPAVLIGEDGDHFLKYKTKPMTLYVDGQYTVNNHAHMIVGTELCIIKWFYYAYQYKSLLNAITRQGAGRYKLTKKALEKLPLQMPCLNEQKQVVDIISTQDKVIELKEKRLAEKQRQKKYLMQQLLTGRKRLQGFTEYWAKHKLVDISKYKASAITANSLENYSGEKRYPVYDANSILCYVDYYESDMPYVSIVKDGAGAGRVALSAANSSVIGTMAYIYPTEEILVEYLYYSLANISFAKYCNGSTIPHVYYKDYGCEQIFLPCQKEQQAIVSVLNAADKEIDLFRQDIEQEKQKKKALMQLLLTGIVRVIV